MANEFAKNIKTTDDLTSFTSMLTKQVIGDEMEEHLGYSKNQQISPMQEMALQRKHSKALVVKFK